MIICVKQRKEKKKLENDRKKRGIILEMYYIEQIQKEMIISQKKKRLVGYTVV